MKQFLIILLSLLLVFFVCSYMLIPDQLEVVSEKGVAVNPRAADRVLLGNWKAWWPGEQEEKGKFSYHEKEFLVDNRLFYTSAMRVSLDEKKEAYGGRLQVLPITTDSALLKWIITVPAGKNPFKRIASYRDASEIKRELDGILEKAAVFLRKEEHLYGLRISEETVKDTLLLVTSASFSHYPSTSQVYALVEKLEQQIASSGIVAMNAPMLHVTTDDSSTYQLMVALPVNLEISPSAGIAVKRMVPGKILVGEVRGGPAAVQKGFEGMQLYAEEHLRTMPAKPFASLVTDRRKEKDSSRWITRIYMPVF